MAANKESGPVKTDPPDQRCQPCAFTVSTESVLACVNSCIQCYVHIYHALPSKYQRRFLLGEM